MSTYFLQQRIVRLQRRSIGATEIFQLAANQFLYVFYRVQMTLFLRFNINEFTLPNSASANGISKLKFALLSFWDCKITTFS